MEAAATNPHIILIGPMGAGKTTIGNRVADTLDLPMIDSDALIEALEGTTGAAIANRYGVERLHALELDVFLAAAESEVTSVICPAESVIDDPVGRTVLASNVSFWIDADQETLRSRHLDGPHRRPMSPEEFTSRRAQRDPYLEALCRHRIDTTLTAVEDAVAEVCERVGGAR